MGPFSDLSLWSCKSPAPTWNMERGTYQAVPVWGEEADAPLRQRSPSGTYIYGPQT